ncbi:MAG: CARDB domain-containing protein [Halobacteriaceae archaeon]
MFNSRYLVAIVIVILATPTISVAVEDPRFEVNVPEPTLVPGQTTKFTVQLTNDAADVGDRVGTARNVKVTLQSGDTPISVKSGSRLIETMPDGQPIPVSFLISVPANIDSGTYVLPIKVTYTYNGDRKTTTVSAKVVIEDYARFKIISANSNTSVGGTGTLTLTIKNTGSESANAATITVQSQSSDILFGQARQAARFIGQISPGETTTVRFQMTARESADTHSYALTAAISYEDSQGNLVQSQPLSFGITPQSEQQFTISVVDSNLRVGEEGNLTLRVTNKGPNTVTHAVVQFLPQSQNVLPLETEYAVGTLQPGESTTVTFPIEISSNAKPIPRQMAFQVMYQNRESKTRISDRLLASVNVAPETDQFLIESIDATVTQGGTATITLQITNNGQDTITNRNAKLFADDPISSVDDTAFIPSLKPEETATITFQVSVNADALAKVYPLSMDFQYDINGDSKLSETYQIPLNRFPVPLSVIAGVIILIVILGGVIWYRRR